MSDGKCLFFFLSYISHIGWVELISSVAWIYVNVGLGGQYGTRSLNHQFLCARNTHCRPYDGLWSKSMVGFGPEDNHFVVELTYNYGVKKYKRGNDFQVSG